MDKKLLRQLTDYIDSRFIQEDFYKQACEPAAPLASRVSKKRKTVPRQLDDLDNQLEETFSRHLFRLIREKGVSEVDTYKTAGIDRKLFSKIRSRDEYSPTKRTALSLALALKLTLDETLDLLGRAGYTLSHSSKGDLVAEFFIEQENYSFFEINEALLALDLPLL